MNRNFVLRFTAAALVVALFGPSGCKPKPAPKTELSGDAADSMPVETTVTRATPMPVSMTLTGTLRPDREARVAATVAGRVLKIKVDRGTKVAAGDVLAELDASTASLSAAEAQKSAQTAKVQRELAKRDCDRAQQLFEGGAISKSELDARKAQCDSADLGVDVAGLRASLGAQMIRDASVRAPFAGVVESRTTELGEYLMPGSPVVTLVATDKLRLEVVVPEAQLARVALDTEMSFRVATYRDRTFTAKVRVIGAMVREGTRDVLVEAAVDNADGALKPGMFTTVDVVTSEAPSPVVPTSAIVRRGEASHVFVVVEGRAHERIVKLGPERAGEVAVLRGVAVGDKVVTKPHEALKNGAPVSEGG